jgi:nucleotide-binding universal stress UspA family protein
MPEQYFEQLRKHAQEELQKVADKVRSDGQTAVTTDLTFDYPARAILERAKNLPADLIVIGTRGLTGMKHLLLGSIAERVVRLAPCDVLTVKDPAGHES